MKPAAVGTLVASTVVLVGCQDPTAVRVEVFVQADCPGAETGGQPVYDSTGFVVSRPEDLSGRPALDVATDRCAAGAPLSRVGDLVVQPGGQTEDFVGLEVYVGLGDKTAEDCAAACGPNCIEASRRLSFVDGVTLYLPIEARQSCLGVCCDEPNQTCVAGVCVDDTVVDPCLDDGEACDEPLELDVVATANLNSERSVTILGGSAPFTVDITEGEGRIEGEGSTYTLTTGPNAGPLTLRVTDEAGDVAEKTVEVGGSHLFVLGGFARGGESAERVRREVQVTVDGSAWDATAELPRPLSGSRAVVWRDEIWLVGGSHEDGDLTVPTVYSSRDGRSWSERVSLPQGRNSGVLWVTANGLVYAGGTYPTVQHGAVNSAFLLETPGGAWQSLPPLEVGVSHQGAVRWRGSLWILGDNKSSGVIRATEGPNFDSWSEDGPPLAAGAGSAHNAATVFDNEIWLAGGDATMTNQQGMSLTTIVRTVSALEGPDATWASRPDLPAPRRDGAMVVHDGQLWYLGGSEFTTNRVRPEVWTLDGATWVERAPLEPAVMFVAAVSFTPSP
ncbi:MAG: hypothetical protein AAGN82_13155 [Myxococcota bacterium]